MSDQSNAKKITWVADSIGYRVLADGRTRSYCIDYFDAHSTRCRVFKSPETGGPMRTEKEAKAALAHVTVRKAHGGELVKSKVRLETLAQEWLERQVGAGTGTMTGWQSNLRLHVLPALGRYEVARINEHHIRDLMLEKRKAGLSEATIANIVQPMRMILGEAVNQRILATNPWERVPKKERPKPSQGKKKRRVLTLDEVDRLLAGAGLIEQGDAVRMTALVSVFVYAGLRKSEALGLVWGDVDFDKGVLNVELQLARTGTGRVALKTDSSERQIPLSRELRASLAAWKMRSHHSGQGDFVFATATGTPITPRNCYRMVVDLAEKVGINHEPEQEKLPNMDIHSLRHVFASAMIRVTQGDAERVARLTGHADTEVLTRIYSHEFDAARGGRTVEQEAKLIDEAFGR